MTQYLLKVVNGCQPVHPLLCIKLTLLCSPLAGSLPVPAAVITAAEDYPELLPGKRRYGPLPFNG